jgi:Tfp pilus assembly protein PilN
MGRALDPWRPERRYPRRLSMAAGVGLIVGLGMAGFALLFAQSPFILGPIAGVSTFLIILLHG